jgi:hypothetical protein
MLKPAIGMTIGCIEEWKPFWISPGQWGSAIATAILCVVALAAWRFDPKRHWTHFLWVLLTAILTIRSRHMAWVAAIMFLAIMAANARYLETPNLWLKWRKYTRGDLTAAIPTSARTIAHIGAVACLLMWITVVALRHAPGGEAGPWTLFARHVPEGASRFLSRQPQSLRVFNDCEDSSYLQWRLNASPKGVIEARGRHPLYIDLLNGRPDSLVAEYIDILDATPRGLQKLRARKISCVVLGERRWKKPLTEYLQKNSRQWKLVFNDKQSKIWMRRAGNAR